MTINLASNENQRRTLHRVLIKKAWSKGTWRTLPSFDVDTDGPQSNGFYVESYSRRTLPEIGEAWFRFEFGHIDGINYHLDDTPGTTSSLVPDLTGFQIRIQAAAGPTLVERSDPEYTPAWRTVWLGTCEYHLDLIAPGSASPIGKRRYYCLDLLARKKHRPMLHHGAYINGETYQDVEGHPGYNVSRKDGVLLGNRQADGAAYTVNEQSVLYHVYPGAGTTWTDKQIVEHADFSTAAPGDPSFPVSETVPMGYSSLLASTSAWKVPPGTLAWDFMAKILRRQRGRGVAFLDWSSDSANPTGNITSTRLKVNSQTYDDIVYQLIEGGDVQLAGASTNNTDVDVDLTGDHRNIKSAFRLGTRHQHKVDYLESVGERMQVLVTLGYPDSSLEKRWTNDERDDFLAITDPDKRIEARWDPVYNVHRLKAAWLGTAGDGNGESTLRVDYRCDDTGAIVAPALTDAKDTSPLTCRFLTELPLYEGYNYEGETVVRYDLADETTEPERQKPLLLLKTADDRFIDGRHEPDHNLSMAFSETELEVKHGSDGGERFVGDLDEPTLNSSYTYTVLDVTLAIELPHRIRFATGKSTGERKLRVEHPDHHLWLAAPNAIWALDANSRDGDGSPPRRECAGGSAESNEPGILRDDRNALAQKHAMSWAWYGFERRSARWSLKCCGFLPSFTDVNGSHAYPQLGQVVHTLNASGTDWLLDTPVTGVEYDNESQTTTWVTDWQDLDFDRGQ